MASEGQSGTIKNQKVIDEINSEIKLKKIGLLVIDPFVIFHNVNENDNGAIDIVVKAIIGIANETRCCVHIVHHIR